MKKIIALLMTVQCGVLFAATANETPVEKRANQPVKFSITAGAQYTDNRDGLPQKESATDLYITPMLALDLKWEETQLELSYAPTFRYRNNASDYENSGQLYHDFIVNFNHKLTPSLEFRLLDHFNISDDPSVQSNGSTLRRDYSFTLNEAEIGAKYQASRLTYVDVLGRYMTKSYDNADVRKESDVNKTEAGINFWHQPAKQFGLMASADYSKYGYEKYKGLSGIGFDRGFDSILLGLGLDEVFSPNFRCNLSGGMQNVKYVDSTLGSDSAPYVTLSAQASAIPSTRITGSISKMIRESYVFPYASQDMTDFSLRLDWDSPVPELAFGLTGAYRMSDYSADTLNQQQKTDSLVAANQADYGLTLNGGKENTTVVSGDVGYKIALGTTLKFVLSHEKIDSKVRSSFDRNTANVMLTREF